MNMRPIIPPEPDTLAGLIGAILVGLFLLAFIIISTTTPAENANRYDAMGQTTGIRWR